MNILSKLLTSISEIILSLKGDLRTAVFSMRKSDAVIVTIFGMIEVIFLITTTILLYYVVF